MSTQRPVYVTHDESELPAIVEQARWNHARDLEPASRVSRASIEGRAIALPFDGEPTTEELLNGSFVMGTPDTCIAKIKQLRDVMGIDHFNANFWFGDLSQEQVLDSMTLFAEEVLPVLKSDAM